MAINPPLGRAESRKLIIEKFLREVDCLLLVAIARVLLDPVEIICHIGVDRWVAFGAAFLLPEADDAREHPLELLRVVMHQGRAAVT
jgi:hypothetical protein